MLTLGVLLCDFCPPKAYQNDVRKVMKNEAPKKADLGPGGGGLRPGCSGENPYGCGKTHIFRNSDNITEEGHTYGPGWCVSAPRR